MLSSASLDHYVHLLIDERLAQAQHQALVDLALTSLPHRAAIRQPRLRPRLASALRGLACRLDPSPALNT
jgi:hypothetical protein